MANKIGALRHDFARLRDRLTEAEETLHAIRSGEADALVVDGPGGLKVFTLKGAEEPYRALVERMHQGALTLTPDGCIVYANRCFADFVGCPLERVIGKDIREFVSGEADFVNEAIRAGRLRREIAICRADGSTFPALVAFSSLPIDGVPGLCVVVSDLTDRKRAEVTAAAELFVRSILEQATGVMVVCDTRGWITHANFAAGRLARGPLLDRPFTEAFPLVIAPAPGGTPQNDGDPITHVIATASRGEPLHGVEVNAARIAGSSAYFLLSAGPLYIDGREPAGCIVTLTDISERKRAEERQKILISELNHRVKNNLAVVQAIVSQTMRTSSSLDSFEDALYGRLSALAVGHDALMETAWSKVDLSQLVNQVIAPFRGGDVGARVEVSGPSCSLSARGVLALTMVVHELATNATKHGALSKSEGVLGLIWELAKRDGKDWVRLSWSERNGPPVSKPKTRGFGTRLVERAVASELGGVVQFDFAPEGFRCLLEFALDQGETTIMADAVRTAHGLA